METLETVIDHLDKVSRDLGALVRAAREEGDLQAEAQGRAALVTLGLDPAGVEAYIADR